MGLIHVSELLKKKFFRIFAKIVNMGLFFSLISDTAIAAVKYLLSHKCTRVKETLAEAISRMLAFQC